MTLASLVATSIRMAETQMTSQQGLSSSLPVPLVARLRHTRQWMGCSWFSSYIQCANKDLLQSLFNCRLLISDLGLSYLLLMWHTRDPLQPVYNQIQYSNCSLMLSLFLPSQPQQPSMKPGSSSCTLVLNPRVEQLLASHNPVAIITASVSTPHARKFVRTMLLPSNEAECPAEGPAGLGLMYGKMQMGYNSMSESFSWVYCEVDHLKEAGVSSIMASLSCALLVEESGQENDGNFIKESLRNFQSITGRQSSIYILTSRETPAEQKPYEHYIKLPTQMNVDRGEAALIQSLIQNSRKIVSESFVLTNPKGLVVSSAVVPYYLSDCTRLGAKHKQGHEAWNYAYALFQEELGRKCLSQYREKMGRMYEDSRKFIPMKILANSHDITSQNVIKSISKYRLSSSSFIQGLQSSIQSQLSGILNQVAEINLRCGKAYIEAEISAIEGRVKNREIKALNSLKYEMGHFLEFFYKKTDSLNCRRLQVFCQNYLIEKSFQLSAAILQNEKKSMTTDLEQAKAKLARAETQVKQLRKQQSKESSQALLNYESLQQKIKYAKNREELLQNSISKLKLQLQQKDEENSLKLQQLQNEYLRSLGQIKQSKAVLNEQVQALSRKLIILQSQIQKQKELHRQTSEHYSQLVRQFKAKEAQLKQEMTDLTMRTSQDLQLCRRDTERSLTQSTISNTHKQREGLKVLEELTDINRRYGQLEKAYNHLQYELQLKKSQFQTEKADLELALKLAEQRALEYQSRLPRFQHMQDEIQSHEKAISEQTILRKQSEKEVALLRQHNSFISDQLRQLELRYEAEKLNSQEYKHSLEELEEHLSELNTVRVNEWVQTDVDSRLVEQLLEIQDEFSKLEKLHSSMKIKASRQTYGQERAHS